jgi:hypothetical protein
VSSGVVRVVERLRGLEASHDEVVIEFAVAEGQDGVFGELPPGQFEVIESWELVW